jgi:NadR type nicotinamide-nucleotide adenylyltransferase
MEQGLQTSNKLIKVAITGPESTGKSSLACDLANHYNTLWVPEFARDYLNKIDRPYTYQDVEDIAKGQLLLEDQFALKANRYLFCDTELIVIKIWMEYKFKMVPDWINEQIRNRQYDHFLLCNIDIPWEPDPLRENPQLRRFFFEWFVREIESNNINYTIISGNQHLRQTNAINTIDTLFPAIV